MNTISPKFTIPTPVICWILTRAYERSASVFFYHLHLPPSLLFLVCVDYPLLFFYDYFLSLSVTRLKGTLVPFPGSHPPLKMILIQSMQEYMLYNTLSIATVYILVLDLLCKVDILLRWYPPLKQSAFTEI